MRNRTYGGVRGRKTKVGRKLLRFPPTRLLGMSLFFYEGIIVAKIYFYVGITKRKITFFENSWNIPCF